MVVDLQGKVNLSIGDVRDFVRKLRAALRLEGWNFNVCFVDDLKIQRMNAQFRGKPRSTDVLSFPWIQSGLKSEPKADSWPRSASPGMTAASKCHPDPAAAGEGSAFLRCGQRKSREGRSGDEFAGFLGDIVISAETARRNAALAGHFTLHEIRWLILHGLLHLLGYDHETDHGEMTRLELSLRGRLGIDGVEGKLKAIQKAKGKKQGKP